MAACSDATNSSAREAKSIPEGWDAGAGSGWFEALSGSVEPGSSTPATSVLDSVPRPSNVVPSDPAPGPPTGTSVGDAGASSETKTDSASPPWEASGDVSLVTSGPAPKVVSDSPTAPDSVRATEAPDSDAAGVEASWAGEEKPSVGPSRGANGEPKSPSESRGVVADSAGSHATSEATAPPVERSLGESIPGAFSATSCVRVGSPERSTRGSKPSKENNPPDPDLPINGATGEQYFLY